MNAWMTIQRGMCLGMKTFAAGYDHALLVFLLFSFTYFEESVSECVTL